MTNSHRIAKVQETEERSRMRRMALATIHKKNRAGDLIADAIALYGITCGIGFMAYILYNVFIISSPAWLSLSMIRQNMLNTSYLILPPATLVVASKILIDYRAQYQEGLAKARKLKEVKEHEYQIEHLYSDTYKLSGTITRVGRQIEYTTSIDEKEIQAFEQL